MKKTEAKKSRATVPLRKKISYLIEENILLHAKALSDAQMIEESALLHLQGKGFHISRSSLMRFSFFLYKKNILQLIFRVQILYIF